MSARNRRGHYRGLSIAALAALALGPSGARPAPDDGAPAAVTDVAATALDSPVDVAVLANDSDPDGDLLSLTAVTAPAHGSATVNGDLITYAPAPGFEGIDHFVYTISDGNDHTALGLVSVYVGVPPPPPPLLTVSPAFLDYGTVPVNKTKDLVLTVTNDTELPVALSDFFVMHQAEPRPFDATDFEGCRSPAARVLEPGQSCTQKVRFWSVPGAGGASGATMRLFDGVNFENTLATVALFAATGPPDTGPNLPPVAVDDLAGVAPGFTHLLDAVRNDSDPDHDILRITAISAPSHGTAAVVSCESLLLHPAADCVRYVPEAGYLGTDALAYTVSDGRGGTASATFHLAVGNVVPVVESITPHVGSTAGGQPIRITGTGFVHDSGADFLCPGGVFPLAVSQLTDTQILATTPSAPAGLCAVRVRTRFGQVGQLANAYRYKDPPVAQDVAVATDEDTAVTITLVATGPSGDPLPNGFSIVSGPSHGALSAVSGNQVTYTPAADYHGADAFTFKASDGELDSNTATVSITVRPVADVLLAVDDAYTVRQDTPLMSGTVLLETFLSHDVPVKRLTDMEGTAFFLGAHPTRGTGLWRTDGTVQGTTLVKAGSIADGYLTRVGKTLFFNDGRQLWKSDGTPQGTVLLHDFTGGTGAKPFDLTAVGGSLFFLVNTISASGDIDGQELWKSDGTAAGTVLVEWLNPGFQAALSPLYPTNVNGTLFLRVQNGTHQGGVAPEWFDLWKSDGTPESTVRLKEVNPGNLSFLDPYPNTLANVDGTLFFAADEPPRNGPLALDLWKSDGTPEGTVKVKVLGAPNVTNPTDLTNVNGTLFFIVHSEDNLTGGVRNELWKSDGTGPGTTLVKTMPGSILWQRPGFLTPVGDTVFFASVNTVWKSDGTPQGTVQVAPGDSVTKVNGTVFFLRGGQIWKTDGTAAGTVLVKELRSPGAQGVIPDWTGSGGTLFLAVIADSANLAGRELWASGTAASLLANDLVPTTGTPSAAVVTPPSHGDLTLNPDGTFFYRPEPGFTGADSFTYRVETEDQTSNVATVTITVTAGPPPTVSVAGASVLEGNVPPNTTVPVVITLSGPSGQPVTVGYKTIDDTARAGQGDYVAAAGTVTFAPGQTSRTVELQIVPDTTFEPDERFTIRLTTAAGATVADGHASVTAVNDDANVPPLAADDGPFSVLEGDVLTVPPPGVLANDADAEHAPLTARFVTAPAHGVLFLRTSGGFDYTPGVGYVGPDSFTYVANDGHADSNVVTVSLVVRPRVVVIDVAETIQVTDTVAVDPAVMIEVAETIQVSDGVSVEAQPATGHEFRSGLVPPGGTLTTDTEGDGATPGDVIETTVLTPQGGQVTIDEAPAPPPLPTAFTFLPLQVEITAPPGTAGQPLLLTFFLEGSVLPAGATAGTLAVFRDGVEVGPCAPGAQGATPDPCLASRQAVNGDPRLVVRTSRASVWTFGVPRSTSGLATGTLRPLSGGSVALVATKIHGQLAGALAYQKGSEQFLALRITAFAVEDDGHTAWFAGIGVDGRTFLAYAEDRGASGDVFRLWIRGVEKTGDGRLASGQVVVVP
jgi:ELWxxDGT repeat protein